MTSSNDDGWLLRSIQFIFNTDGSFLFHFYDDRLHRENIVYLRLCVCVCMKKDKFFDKFFILCFILSFSWEKCSKSLIYISLLSFLKNRIQEYILGRKFLKVYHTASNLLFFLKNRIQEYFLGRKLLKVYHTASNCLLHIRMTSY